MCQFYSDSSRFFYNQLYKQKTTYQKAEEKSSIRLIIKKKNLTTLLKCLSRSIRFQMKINNTYIISINLIHICARKNDKQKMKTGSKLP
jgi:hypothetical protein